MRDDDLARLGIDADVVARRSAQLREAGPELAEKVRRVFAISRDRPAGDVDGSIYGGFLGDGDKRQFTQVRATAPAALGERAFSFQDPRLPELLFRYRARNWPHTLTAQERERWDSYRRERLVGGSGSEYSFETFRAEVHALRMQHAGDGDRLALLDRLQAWGQELETGLV